MTSSFLGAVDRSELERTIRQVHLGCKFCGSVTAVNERMKMSLDEAAPAVVKGCRGITRITDSVPTDDFDSGDERADLLGTISSLAYLIEQATDPAKIAGYVDQLNELKAKLYTNQLNELKGNLTALGPAKKSATHS